MNIDKPNPTQIPALRNLWKEAFGDTDAFLDTFFSTAFREERCRLVTIEVDVAAALYWFDCLYMDQPVAYIYAVATATAYRGQGICHKLMADTSQHLKKLGYAGILLVPGSKALFSFYENMGFQTCSSVKKIDCEAACDRVDIKRIDTSTYQALRRQYLPSGSVIQEKENLTFLETLSNFYSGSDFLLAAYTKKGILYGTELLGNTAAAPNIVKALNCETGSFRTPGEGTAFAMYLPLKLDSLPAPYYFGLAFD